MNQQQNTCMNRNTIVKLMTFLRALVMKMVLGVRQNSQSLKSSFFYITPNPKARLPARQGSKKKNFLEVPLRGFRGKKGILSYTHGIRRGDKNDLITITSFKFSYIFTN